MQINRLAFSGLLVVVMGLSIAVAILATRQNPRHQYVLEEGPIMTKDRACRILASRCGEGNSTACNDWLIHCQ